MFDDWAERVAPFGREPPCEQMVMPRLGATERGSVHTKRFAFRCGHVERSEIFTIAGMCCMVVTL